MKKSMLIPVIAVLFLASCKKDDSISVYQHPARPASDLVVVAGGVKDSTESFAVTPPAGSDSVAAFLYTGSTSTQKIAVIPGSKAGSFTLSQKGGKVVALFRAYPSNITTTVNF